MLGEIVCARLEGDNAHPVISNLKLGLRKRRGDFDKGVLFEEDSAGFVVDLAVDAEKIVMRICVCCATVTGGVSVGLGFEEVCVDVIAYLAWKL